LPHVHHLMDNLYPNGGHIFTMCMHPNFLCHMRLHSLVTNLIANGCATLARRELDEKFMLVTL
jgi:hypothetical protein